MFISNDSIKFMIAKIFFTLAEFKYNSIRNKISYNYHGKETIEINYIVSGNGKVKINNDIIELEANSYFVIPEFVPYSIITNDELNIYSVYFIIDKTSAFEEYIPFLTKIYIGKDESLEYLFKTIHSEFMTKKLGYNEIVTSTFKTIFMNVVRNAGMSGKRISYWPLESLQFTIDKILASEFNTITIVDLANRLNMSIRDLQRYFLKNYNKSFSELKKNFKIEYAKNRLIYYNDSIEKISNDLNFSSREHFCYFFKKETGQTPLKFRKNNMGI